MATGPLEKTIPCTVEGCDRMFARPHDLETHLRNGHREQAADEPAPDAHSAQPADHADRSSGEIIEAPAVHTGEPATISSLPHVGEPAKPEPMPFRTGPSGTKSAIPANADDAARMAVQAIKTARECMTAVRRAHVQGGASLADEVANPLGRALRMICERFPDADK